MRSYSFSMLSTEDSPNLIGEGYGQGRNAIEAFEDGVEQGTVILQPQIEITVIATSNTGLQMSFMAHKQF